MPFLALILSLFTTLSLTASIASAQGTTLPDSGTYFITNVGSDEAIQPLGATPGQNVFMYPSSKSGMQKWVLIRKIDPITKKPTNRYTIKTAGETTLYLQPHPSVSDHTSILLPETSTYSFKPTASGILIESVALNGDAMYAFANPPSNNEVRFGPSDGSTKFYWVFTPAD